MESWDSPAYTPPRCRTLLRALALLGVTAAVVAAAVAASLSPAVRCSVRTFLWLSAASILVLAATRAVVHTSSRARKIISRWLPPEALPAWSYAAAAALALGVGSFGLVAVSSQSASAGDDDAPSNGESSIQWPLVVASVIAVLWTVAAILLLVMALLTALRRIQPGQETPPAIMVLRCSCCSVAVKRLVMVLPFVALSATSVVLWRQARARGNGCELEEELTRLLLGATAVFGSMAVSLVAVSACQWGTRGIQPTHKRRRRLHVATLFLLLTFGTVAVAWAVECCVWLRSHHFLVISTSNAQLCHHIKQTHRSVQLVTGALFTVGTLLLTVTCCCRLERHLLRDTASTPTVDLSMLSPHAIRPPALTKSPSDQAV